MEFDNSQYNGQYNNASYGMPNPQPVKDDDDGGSNIDFFAWAVRILKGWWLFLIFITIFMIAAFLKNMKWAPQYTSSALVIIEENKGMMNSSNVLMQGFVAEHAYRNVNNQVIMFGSFDLISRVIGKHPEFTTDYYTRGHFKTTNYYKRSPIDIKKDFVVAGSYNREFEFEDNSDGTYKIIIPEGRDTPEVILKGKYGEPLESSFFFLTVDKTPMFYQGCKLYFTFYEKEQLAMNYSSRLAFDFLMQGASVVKCTVTGGVPEKDQDFLNALCDEFLADNLARKNDAAIKTIDFIDEQMSSLSDSIRVSEGQLNNYRSSNFVSSTAGGSLLVSQYNTVVAKLSEMRLKESYLKYLKDYLQNNVEDGTLMAPTDLGINESALTSLVTKYTETQIKRNEVGAKSPLYTKYGRELDTYKVQINEVLKNVKVEMDLQKTELTAQMANIEKAMQEQPYKEQQLQHIERRFKLNDDYYSFLMQKRADAQIQKASNSPDNIILERARFSTLTNGAEKNKTYSTYFIIGLLIPLGIIILKEMLVPYIRTEQEITKLSENRGAIIGVIRHTNSRSPVIVDKHPKSSVAESYRVIRTQIEYVLHRKENITVMITSTQSGDGKTYISANMAGVYAVTGKKTLLIDLDMRKPSVQSLLSIDYNRGISDYLTGDISLEQAIIKDSRYRFDMLLVGTIPPSPGELLKSDMMKRLMEKLKKECIEADNKNYEKMSIGGYINIFWLLCVIASTMFINSTYIPAMGAENAPWYLRLLREWVFILIIMGSWFTTKKQIRIDNNYSWTPILEVACVFIGIFATMAPALLYLSSPSVSAAIAEVIKAPWHYVYCTGLLSSFLDNAPTAMVFNSMAVGAGHISDIAAGLANDEYLKAISMGAVFFGSMTYIGNGPNFMVKSIAEQNKIDMPSFFGYMIKFSLVVLLPIFIITQLIFI